MINQNMKEGYIPKEQRKKILLITDDILLPSGVGSIGKEIVLNTAHKYNWCCLGGAINHPHKGKRFDLCEETNKIMGLTDASVFSYPCDGYGEPNLLRQIINMEKPDAIFLITDPRYFAWLFHMENEIRKKIPIVYLNIWDNYPAPLYNLPYYESCDALFGISKQTVNINKLVLKDKVKGKILRYIPHGKNDKEYFPLENPQDNKDFQEFKKNILRGNEYDFVLFFNSRNIRRKKPSEIMFAFKMFLDTLPKEKADKCVLILHTHPIDENGTDLTAVQEYLFGRNTKNILFSDKILNPHQLNYLYNIADCQILISNAEGWGLSVTEALLAGTPFIGSVTGGIADQMRFENENGDWKDYDEKFFSHYRSKFKYGEWAFPIFPTNRSVIGSIPTPYIFDDNCNFEDVFKEIQKVYNLGREELKRRGLKGREWALGDEAGFTSKIMGERVIEGLEMLFSRWKPREKFEIVNANEYKDKKINHQLEC